MRHDISDVNRVMNDQTDSKTEAQAIPSLLLAPPAGVNIRIGTLVPPEHIVFGVRNNRVSRPDEGGQRNLLRFCYMCYVNCLMI